MALGVPDLGTAASRLRATLGLGSVEGGRHVGVGTGNRIVPLGASYLELVSVMDAEEARGHPFGRRVLASTEGGEGFLGWCLRTADLDAVAGRLDLVAESWERRRPEGETLRWRLAGLDAALEEPSLPFFIQWDVEERLHPGRAQADHAAPLRGIAWVEVAGDVDRLVDWIGDADVPMRVVSGEPGVRAVGLLVGGAEVVLRPSPG